jgi:hypothetical protein
LGLHQERAQTSHLNWHSHARHAERAGGAILGLRKQLELVAVEADQQLSRLSGIERDQFLNRVFAYEDSVLDPRLWWSAVTAGTQFAARSANLLAQWWGRVSPEANFGVLAVTVLSLLIATWAWRGPAACSGDASPELPATDGRTSAPARCAAFGMPFSTFSAGRSVRFSRFFAVDHWT